MASRRKPITSSDRWTSPKTGKALSEDYQRRLMHKGISKREFESGKAYGSSTFHRARRGAKSSAVIVIERGKGPRPISGLNAGQRSLVARHANAVKEYAETGDSSALVPFEGKKVDGIELMSNGDEIDDLLASGVDMSFENLYREVAS